MINYKFGYGKKKVCKWTGTEPHNLRNLVFHGIQLNSVIKEWGFLQKSMHTKQKRIKKEVKHAIIC